MSVDLFKVTNLLPNFVAGVKTSYQKKNWNTFIDQFGTHVVYDVIMGGRATQETTYSYEAVTKMNSLNIDLNLAAKAKYAGFYGDASFDWKKHKE